MRRGRGATGRGAPRRSVAAPVRPGTDQGGAAARGARFPRWIQRRHRDLRAGVAGTPADRSDDRCPRRGGAAALRRQAGPRQGVHPDQARARPQGQRRDRHPGAGRAREQRRRRDGRRGRLRADRRREGAARGRARSARSINDEAARFRRQAAAGIAVREGARRDRRRHRHAGAAARARPLHAGRDRGQRARRSWCGRRWRTRTSPCARPA